MGAPLGVDSPDLSYRGQPIYTVGGGTPATPQAGGVAGAAPKAVAAHLEMPVILWSRYTPTTWAAESTDVRQFFAEQKDAVVRGVYDAEAKS